MENGCLITLIENFRGKDMSAFPVIFSQFEGLIHYYSGKEGGEDTFQELSVFLLELLYKVDIKRFEKKSGDGLKRYIAVCIGNRYIALCKQNSILKKNNVSFSYIASHEKDFLQNQMLKDAMDKLTHKQREIIILKYIYNYSDVEIALALDISRQAVNRIKNRAVVALREYLI